MSAGVRVPAATARAVADQVVERLRPACTDIEVAGSLRRGEGLVGDIEIVCQSRTHAEPSGLFFEVDAVVYDVDRAIDELIADGVATRLLGKDRYQKLRHVESGLQLDLFLVKPPATWGVILLIRTGPAAFSQRVVTEARRRGYHVARGQLHRGGLGCGEYVCEPVNTSTEIDVFAHLGMGWLLPEERA